MSLYTVISRTSVETDQPLHANFGLSHSGEDVVLTNNLGVIVDYTTFSQMPSDTSMGRDPKDNSQWTSFEKVTPGYANTDEGYEQFLASRKVDSSPAAHQRGYERQRHNADR